MVIGARSERDGWLSLARLAGAGLLLATGGVHLDLYLTGYRSIPTIGWLFLLQVVTAFALAVAVALLDSPLVATAGALFALTTLGGYLLSIWIGLFGFKEVRTTAGIAAGVIEVAAFALLASIAASRLPPSRRAGRLAGTVAALGLVALGVLSAAFATAGTAPSAASHGAPGGTELKARLLGGRRVLTNAKGFTLYWFARDSRTTSRCNGSCTAYWPPVYGRPKAAPGLDGRLGSIRRSGGALQATYDGHPLYTYVGDEAPGEARGNGLDINGGLWHEVAVTG